MNILGFLRVVTLLALSVVWPASASDQKFQPVIELTIESPLRPVFHGRTNLPRGSELLLTLARSETLYMAQSKIVVEDGYFRTERFSSRGGPLAPGRYKITITMAAAFLQPKSVQETVGDRGQRMAGRFVSVGPLGTVFEYAEQRNLGGPADALVDAATRAREVLEIRKWLIEGCSSNIDFVNAMVLGGVVSGRQIVGDERRRRIDACTADANNRLFE